MTLKKITGIVEIVVSVVTAFLFLHWVIANHIADAPLYTEFMVGFSWGALFNSGINKLLEPVIQI